MLMKVDKSTIREKLNNFLSAYDDAILVFLFGSYAGDEVTVFSDLDIAIFFRESPDIYAFNELREKLERTLHIAVDVVTLNSASPVIRMQVLKKGVLLINRDARVYNTFFVDTVKAYDDLKRNRKEIEENILKGRIYA
jgi:predicted nucleotidyltransferase